MPLLDSMLILLTVNRATRLLCVMYCRFILVEASMDIEYNCVCGYVLKNDIKVLTSDNYCLRMQP